MSADESPNPTPLKLGEYIAALIDALGDANPAALSRMRRVVGERRARIILDDEAVDVFFDDGSLHVQTATDKTKVDGIGETDSATVLALLDGYLEVEAAILNGRLRVFGAQEDITRMFAAIEILLDVSPRTPTLQRLAARFRRERREQRGLPVSDQRRVTWYPFGSRASEYELLARLDLLPSDN
jgi:hypothetical protein